MSQWSKLGRIHVVDLSCRSAPYDARLVSALQGLGIAAKLWLAGCLPDQRVVVESPGTLISSGSTLAVHRFSTLRRVLKSAGYVWNSKRLLRDCQEGDIVHFQWLPMLEAWASYDFYVLRHLREKRIPVVYTVHNVLPHDSGGRFGGVFRKLYQKVDALISHTAAAADRLETDFGVDRQKIYVIPHGELELPLPAARETSAAVDENYNLEHDQPVALLFGFLRPYKGVEELLRAWAMVHGECPEARLVIAGRGSPDYEDHLRALGKESLGEGVIFDFRFLPEEELAALLERADVLVYPYRSVTQSGALLTGMAAGRPIVASRVGGIPEALAGGNAGLLVDPNAPGQLADAISFLFRDPAAGKHLSRQAKLRAETEFGWPGIAEQTADLYSSLLANLGRL